MTFMIVVDTNSKKDLASMVEDLLLTKKSTCAADLAVLVREKFFILFIRTKPYRHLRYDARHDCAQAFVEGEESFSLVYLTPGLDKASRRHLSMSLF